jgi:hypothetical protein
VINYSLSGGICIHTGSLQFVLCLRQLINGALNYNATSSSWTSYRAVLETDTVQRILVELSISNAKEDIQYVDYSVIHLQKNSCSLQTRS